MGNLVENALLVEGGTLYGVSRRQGRGTPSDEVESEFHSWPFGEGDPPVSRADAFALAAKECPIEEGTPLALPPDILVTRVLSLPATDAASLASMVRLKMERFAPVADDELEVAYEAIGATETATRVFAVAIPMSTLDDLAKDLETSGLAVTRIDSALLCEWRSISEWEEARYERPRRQDGENSQESRQDGENSQESRQGNSLYVVATKSGRFDLLAAEASGPLFARTLGALASPDDLARELTLSLLDIASENPAFTPEKALLVTPAGADTSAFAAAIARATGVDCETVPDTDLVPYVQSALERDAEENCIDIVPVSWREDERAATVRRNFIYGAVAAVAVWAVAFAVLLAIPKSIARKTAAVRRDIAAIMPQYGEVAELRTRVRLIQSYEDRSRSAIEVLRQLCERMPDGVNLATFAYEKNDENGTSGRRGGPGGIRATGDAADADSILRLKNTMDETGVFEPARIKGPTMDGQRRRFKFELDWRFAEGGE